jgi:hypothetical protein
MHFLKRDSYVLLLHFALLATGFPKFWTIVYSSFPFVEAELTSWMELLLYMLLRKFEGKLVKFVKLGFVFEQEGFL